MTSRARTRPPHGERLFGEIRLAVPLRWQVLAYLAGAVLVGAACLLAFATIARTETVSGSIVPEGGLLEVHPRREGLVQAMFVREGQLVRQGRPLAHIRTSDASLSGGDRGADILRAISVQEASLQERSAAAQASASLEAATQRSAIADLRARRTAVRSQVAVQTRRVALAAADLARFREVAERGFISRSEIARREDTLLSRELELSTLRQSENELDGSLQQAENSLRQVAARRVAEQAALAGERGGLHKERASVSSERDQIVLAPATGRVAAVSIDRGQTVSPRDPIMMVIPTGQQLVARLLIPGELVGLVSKGQRIRLSVDAFPVARFGSLGGSLELLSDAPIPTGAQPGQAPRYLATAKLDAQHLLLGDRRIVIKPGMTVRAKIVTEERRLLSWLLDPLQLAIAW